MCVCFCVFVFLCVCNLAHPEDDYEVTLSHRLETPLGGFVAGGRRMPPLIERLWRGELRRSARHSNIIPFLSTRPNVRVRVRTGLWRARAIAPGPRAKPYAHLYVYIFICVYITCALRSA
jgi:hypothetical protein